MPKVERVVTENPNGSKTIVRRLVEEVPTAPYAGPLKIMLGVESLVKWPKARDIIPNVPSKRRRTELIKQANMS